MSCAKWILRVAVACGTLACLGGELGAQAPDNQPRANGQVGREQLKQPVYRVAQQAPDGTRVAANNANTPQAGNLAAPGDHPLVPALEIAYSGLNHIRADIKDYSCTMVKRERIGEKLNDSEYMYLKVREQPFSVYMYFLGPEKIKGQEALYVAGKNNGNLLGHGVGIRKIAGTVPLAPTGTLAMAGQRYPITEIGISNLTKRLIEVAEKDKNFGECEVKFYRNAKINNRLCTVIQVMHPVKRKEFLFNKAMVFVDDEYNVPVRYEAWEWPKKPGGPPQLLEEYTYTNLKFNNGFTDADFDEKNPSYNFH